MEENDRAVEEAWAAITAETGEITASSIQQFLRARYAGRDHLRICEYPFLAEVLARTDIDRSVIVDLGGGNSWSTVVPMLFKFPSSRIISLDVLNPNGSSRYQVEYRQGNCMETGLPSNSVSLAISISTFEHVGLGRWGDPLDVTGDIKAMREVLRILRPGGHAVVTLPFGAPTVVYDLHRIYDRGRIARAVEGFEVVEARYSRLGEPASFEEVAGLPPITTFSTFYTRSPAPLPNPQAGIMLLVRKPAGGTS